MWQTVVFCFCVEDMEYFKSEPRDDCAQSTIKMETDDFTVLKAADDDDVMRVKRESECVTPGVLELQQHDTGDFEIVFYKVMYLLSPCVRLSLKLECMNGFVSKFAHEVH